MSEEEFSTTAYFVLGLVGQGAPASEIEAAILRMPSADDRRRLLNGTEARSGVTPLIALTVRTDDDETLRVARVLLEAGADVDGRDDGPGCTALFMAAQSGTPRLLEFLVERGAKIDVGSRTSPTQPLYIACQNGHADCVARLCEAASVASAPAPLVLSEFFDAPSKRGPGRTAAYAAVERARAECVGVLAAAGADLRRACPVYFDIDPDNPSGNGSFVDPEGGPDSPRTAVHAALNYTVRSFVTKSCAAEGCGEEGGEMMRCGRCRMAWYCGQACQKKSWRLHKKCCKRLRAGHDMLRNAGNAPPPPPEEAFGFEEPFGREDETADEDYVRSSHAVWEYDTGGHGHSDWRRYPPRIEENLEDMSGAADGDYMGGRFMYRPGTSAVDGLYEQDLSPRAPPGVATRYVYFHDMLERDVYTGAARAVRRNGSRQNPGPTY